VHREAGIGLAGWLVGWLVGWLAGWLAGCEAPAGECNGSLKRGPRTWLSPEDR